MKRAIAISVLTTMLTGLIGTFAAIYNEVGTLKHKVKTLEKQDDKTDNKIDKILKKVDDIHWYLIEKGK